MLLFLNVKEVIGLLTPNKKVNVFISSACGDGKEKYNEIRKQLKTLIEDTGCAKVYLFEDEAASTLSASQHYLYALEDSDLCIFLIDNADGVPPGVQVEVDCAKKYNKKSLYYFCDQDSPNQTPLQKSLTGAKFAKSKVIHSFDDFIKSGAQGVIDDLILIYKSYCKGKLDAFDNGELSDTKGFALEDSYFRTSLVAPKSTADNTDKCKDYFHKLVAGWGKEIKNTSALDSWCLQFLLILFDGKSINDFNTSLFLKELQKHQLHEYHIGDEAQKEITDSEQALYYPLIDRIHNTLNEKYVEHILKEKIKSPFTITLGHNLDQYTDLLSSAYIVAMFNGSLTHILLLYKQVKLLAFYLCEMFDDWKLRVLLLKGAIINCSEKEIDGITKTFPEILVKMSADDASEIFAFCNNKPIPYQNLMSKLQAYKVVGYFLDDKEFETISAELFKEIDTWFEDSNRVNIICNCLFSCLSGVAIRTEQDDLAEICCRLMEKKFTRWYDNMFMFVYKHLKLNELSNSTAQRLINNIISVLHDGDTKNNANHLNKVLFKFRKQNRALTEELDQVISEQLPDFYNGTYKLETTEDEEEDISEFFEKYIDEINRQNNTQGKNRTFFGFGNRPCATIRSMIMNSKCTFEDELLDRAFIVTSEALLSGEQDIETKCEAIDLIVCLCIKFPEILQRNCDLIEILKNQRSIVQTGSGQMFMSNLTEAVLQFSSLLLYHCFGEKTWLHMIELLPYFQDNISAQIRVCRTIYAFLEIDETMPIDINMESVFLQHALGWAASNSLDVRWYAIQILFSLLRNSDNSSIVCSQLIKVVDSDNLHIKNLVLRKLFGNNIVDKVTREYIFSKCETDSNYVVRKTCAELNV